MTNNYGYIPVRNYIVIIDVLDEADYIFLTSGNVKYDLEHCIYETNNFKVIKIVDFYSDESVDKIEYKINEYSYKFYKKLDNYEKKFITKSYEKDIVYTDVRYYYKNMETAISENFMKYLLYKKYGNNYSGIYKSYHSNGLIENEYFHINGNKHGIVKSYYSNGELLMETEYVNNQKHGTSKIYNGELDVFENYNMGKLDGLCIYNNLGRLNKEYRVEITYKDGIKNGIYRKYHDYKNGGKLQIECNIINNRYFGIYKEYDVDGNLIIECDYKVYTKELNTKDLL